MGRNRFRKATGFARWLLCYFGFDAVTWPDGNIYLLEKAFSSRWLRRHELAHLMQWRRHPWSFWFRIYWQYATAGHDQAPLEIEADAYASAAIGYGTAWRTFAGKVG